MFRMIRYVAALAVLAAADSSPRAHSGRAGCSAGGEPRKTNNLYIVQLAEFPVSSYTGGRARICGDQAGPRPEDRPEQSRA